MEINLVIQKICLEVFNKIFIADWQIVDIFEFFENKKNNNEEF